MLFLGKQLRTSGLSGEGPRQRWAKLKPIPWGGGTPSSSSAETINDGQFHTVELVTFDQMVNLSIDGGSPMTMDNFGKHYTLNSEAPLYVGGKDLAQGEAEAHLSDGNSHSRWGLCCSLA